MTPEKILYDVKSVLFGVAVGDALGVPVEFRSREEIKENPVTGMTGYGTYRQPPGTWSDDSSLTFCLAEALTQDFNLNIIGENFVQWLCQGYWSARKTVFDVGITTQVAINRIAKGTAPELAGGAGENDNGNGSLMRIAPLLFYLSDKPIDQRYAITHNVSAITHRHIRAVIACFYYLEFARQVWEGKDKFEAYAHLQTTIPSYLSTRPVPFEEIEVFNRLLKGNIAALTDDYIYSGGYVLHTLEASIWCLLNTTGYKEAVLKAVNLGGDTDTTAAVTGGLAGLLYGFDNIPQNWVAQIARQGDIEDLVERLAKKLINT
jgi:ADP-ribosylglycohydrolase